MRGYEIYSLGPQVTLFNPQGVPFGIEQVGDHAGGEDGAGGQRLVGFIMGQLEDAGGAVGDNPELGAEAAG